MADSYNTSTSLAEFSPTLTATVAQDAMTDATNNALLQVSFNATDLIRGATSLDIPIFPSLDLEDEVEGTPLEYKQFNAGKVTLTPNLQKAVVIPITDYARARANQDIMSGYARQAGRDAARKVDQTLSNLYSSATLTVTAGTNTDIDATDVLTAKELLDGANAPLEGRWLALHHTQYNALLAIDDFVHLEKYGSNSALPNGVLGSLYGFTVLLDQNIIATTDGFRQNMFGVSGGLAESSIVYGFGTFEDMVSNTLSAGNNPRLIWTYDSKAGSEVLRAEILYGVAASRAEWLGVIKTQDN